MGALGALYTQPVSCCMPTNAYPVHEHKEANMRTTPMVQTGGQGSCTTGHYSDILDKHMLRRNVIKPILWTVRDLPNHHVNPDLWVML